MMHKIIIAYLNDERKIGQTMDGVNVSKCFRELSAAYAWNASRLSSRMLTLPTPPAFSGPRTFGPALGTPCVSQIQAVDRLAARRSEVQASGCVTDSRSISLTVLLLLHSSCSAS
jgi:hypothetical protein